MQRPLGCLAKEPSLQLLSPLPLECRLTILSWQKGAEMGREFEEVTTQSPRKRPWVKPTISRMKAGSAEINTGTVDDGDPGTALTNS